MLTVSWIWVGMLGYDRVHGELMDAVAAGKFLGLEKLVTKKIGIADVVEEGIFSLLKEKDTQSMWCDASGMIRG